MLAYSPPRKQLPPGCWKGSFVMPSRRASVGCRCYVWILCACLCCTGLLRLMRQPAPAVFPDPTCCVLPAAPLLEQLQQAAGQNRGGGVQVGAAAAAVFCAGHGGDGHKCLPGAAGGPWQCACLPACRAVVLGDCTFQRQVFHAWGADMCLHCGSHVPTSSFLPSLCSWRRSPPTWRRQCRRST